MKLKATEYDEGRGMLLEGSRVIAHFDTIETAREAAKAMNSHSELIAALERLIEAAPAFRAAPIGSPWSEARRQQDLHQEAEDIALAVIAKAKGNP